MMVICDDTENLKDCELTTKEKMFLLNRKEATFKKIEQDFTKLEDSYTDSCKRHVSYVW